ncbi:MAG: thioredoxin domain-containing protein [Patescibacteria group bacterium]
MNNKIFLPLGVLGLVFVGFFVFLSYQNAGNLGTSSLKQQPPLENNQATSVKNGRYIDYSRENLDTAKGFKRVYFFHAKWCPSCKTANSEFMEKASLIPQDVVLLKIDYDSETDLKAKYAITYQHTFVYVDEGGKEIKKWNGGGIKELTENTR